MFSNTVTDIDLFDWKHVIVIYNNTHTFCPDSIRFPLCACSAQQTEGPKDTVLMLIANNVSYLSQTIVLLHFCISHTACIVKYQINRN